MNSTAKKISSYNELELKGYLLSMIERAQDRSQLLRVVEAVKDIFEDDVVQKSDWWDDLTLEQQKELEEALAECDDPTKLISHEEATKQIELWLKE